jgi:predicted flap endonuclease-1-like 5' DNA nuclease
MYTMPEITVIHIALLATALIVGVLIGWIFRGRRSNTEKATINAGWQEQMVAQRNEHERLLEQNKSLMAQNSQYQVSNKDSKMRATELSKSLKETFQSRDDLQSQIKDIRSNLEVTVGERDQLQSDVQNRGVEDDVTSAALQQRDDIIAKLTKDLEGWQERVPPLVERFKIRDEDANRLQRELAAAQLRIVALEATTDPDDTRVEQVNPGALGDDLDASNDPIDPPGDNEDTHVSESTLNTEATSVPTEADDARTVDGFDFDHQDEDSGLRDDLKMIKGIGPAIQKTLNEMGIRRFVQIADMSEYDIDRVAQRLKGFRSRIYREDWIGQARDLQNQKLTGQA